jgi:hypothetical protein
VSVSCATLAKNYSFWAANRKPTCAQRGKGMLIHRRTSSLILPEDPSPEELLQYWTLSARDRTEVLRCRGEANRRRFAVQLCTLRAYGRFLPEATSAPVAMTNYLARQLDLPLILFSEVPGRLATETEQLQRIRDYLGWSLFDDRAQQRVVLSLDA